MRLLLYAITSPEPVAGARGGLRGHGLIRVDAAGLTAWGTELDGPGEPWGRADLLEHHAIVTHLHEHVAATLPSRFPTWSADEHALRAELEQGQTALHKALERVRGRSEVAITAVWTSRIDEDQPAAAHEQSGTSFLRARQRAFAGSDARRARARALATELEQLISSDLAEIETTVCPSTMVALSVALLVPTSRALAVMARLPRVQRDVRILVNGPWPPYTFTGVGAG